MVIQKIERIAWEGKRQPWLGYLAKANTMAPPCMQSHSIQPQSNILDTIQTCSAHASASFSRSAAWVASRRGEFDRRRDFVAATRSHYGEPCAHTWPKHRGSYSRVPSMLMKRIKRLVSLIELTGDEATIWCAELAQRGQITLPRCSQVCIRFVAGGKETRLSLYF